MIVLCIEAYELNMLLRLISPLPWIPWAVVRLSRDLLKTESEVFVGLGVRSECCFIVDVRRVFHWHSSS